MAGQHTRASAVRTRHQLLCLPRLPVRARVPEAEVAVVVSDDCTLRSLLHYREKEEFTLVYDEEFTLVYDEKFTLVYDETQESSSHCYPLTYAWGSESYVPEVTEGSRVLSPPHLPPQPGVCGCSGSSDRAGSYNAYHKLQHSKS